MRLIPLTKGHSAIVDDGDYDFLMQWKWTARTDKCTVYARRMKLAENGKWVLVLMHRILNGTPGGFITDHINGNGLDNRRENLRNATRCQNQWNRSPNRDTKSRHKGVSWNIRLKKWCARISVNSKRYHLGYFDNEQDAADVYEARAAREYGQFYREIQL